MTISVTRPTAIIDSLFKVKRIAQAGKDDRFYKIIFGGINFQGYIRSDGGLLIASSAGTAPSRDADALDQVAGGVTYQSDQILTAAILAEIPDIGRVRMETSDRTSFVLDSTDATVLNRIKQYRNLTWNIGDQQFFQIVSNTSNMPISITCTPRRVGLDQVVYHSCGAVSGFHWLGKFSGPWNGSTRPMNLVLYFDDPLP